MTTTSAIHLLRAVRPRVEEGSLVLWRLGLTVWLVAWGNDNKESQARCLAWIKREASADRFAERESAGGGVTRFSYRLLDRSDDGPVESVNAVVIADHGYLQLSVYFDDPADERLANARVDSVTLRPRHVVGCEVMTPAQTAHDRPFAPDDPALNPGWPLLEFLLSLGADEFAVRFLYAGDDGKEECDRLMSQIAFASSASGRANVPSRIPPRATRGPSGCGASIAAR